MLRREAHLAWGQAKTDLEPSDIEGLGMNILWERMMTLVPGDDVVPVPAPLVAGLLRKRMSRTAFVELRCDEVQAEILDRGLGSVLHKVDDQVSNLGD